MITAANAATTGTFPANASLVLTYDSKTGKMTLTQTKLGYEILVSDGTDLLKILGQNTDVDNLVDIHRSPIMVLKYDFLPPSDYLLKRWDQVAFDGAQFTPENGMGNCRMNVKVWYYDGWDTLNIRPHRDFILNAYDSEQSIRICD